MLFEKEKLLFCKEIVQISKRKELIVERIVKIISENMLFI